MALEKVGIKVKKYYASEIKDIAIKTTKENFPDTIHIGDVNNVHYKDGILFTDFGEFEEKFDLVMFGSPCQSFSRAMKTERRIGLDDPRGCFAASQLEHGCQDHHRQLHFDE